MDYIRTEADGQLAFTQSTEYLFLPSCLYGFHNTETVTVPGTVTDFEPLPKDLSAINDPDDSVPPAHMFTKVVTPGPMGRPRNSTTHC